MNAGRLLSRVTVIPALLVVAWLTVSLPLLFAGALRPAPALALFAPVAAVVLWLGLRSGPGPEGGPAGGRDGGGDAGGRDRDAAPWWPGASVFGVTAAFLALQVVMRSEQVNARPGPEGGPAGGRDGGGDAGGRDRDAAPWWPVASVFGVTAAFLALQVVMRSEQIIVRRDPASYVQFATWLTAHGSLPIPLMEQAFGGPDAALSYESPAFYQEGGAIVPQFMAGLPLVLTLGGWAGGTHGILLTAPLLGALCVLSFAGLVARLVGVRWAPAGALLLAL